MNTTEDQPSSPSAADGGSLCCAAGRESTHQIDHAACTTPPKSSGTTRRGGLTASCSKRRRLGSDEENLPETPVNSASFAITSVGSARKLNYETSDDTSDDSDDDDDDDDDDYDPIEQERVQLQNEAILKKIQRVCCENDDAQLIYTASSAALFEYVKDGNDVVAKMAKYAGGASKTEGAGEEKKKPEPHWKKRGSGCVKFIKCLEEGYNCGMIKMELTKNGTLETLMCHELTQEEVSEMPSKKGKGKAYTWRVKDWAYSTAIRTFALRFDDEMNAIQFRSQVGESMRINCRVRRGLDIPDLTKAVDDVCSALSGLSTANGGY